MGRTSHKQGPTIYSLQVGEGYERVVKVVDTRTKTVKITHQVYLEVDDDDHPKREPWRLSFPCTYAERYNSWWSNICVSSVQSPLLWANFKPPPVDSVTSLYCFSWPYFVDEPASDSLCLVYLTHYHV